MQTQALAGGGARGINFNELAGDLAQAERERQGDRETGRGERKGGRERGREEASERERE